MVTHAIGWGPEDPVALVESCYQAVEWLLATHTAKGLLIPRPWIDHPYGEEEITLLEEELLPAMAVFLERVEPLIGRLRLIRSWRWLPIRSAEGQAGGGRPFLLHLGGCSEKELSGVVAPISHHLRF
jgi:hypothetical protein